MAVLPLLLMTIGLGQTEGRPPADARRAGEIVRTGSAVDAERAFAADARSMGQWAAFRKWAAADAIMFVPQPTNAQAWLKDRAEPARAAEWSTTTSVLSCDGKLAVNLGRWQRADGSVGDFTTVWRQQADGSWRWLLTHVTATTLPRPPRTRPELLRAACTPPNLPLFQSHGGGQGASGGGAAPDRSLWWHWEVDRFGWRYIDVRMWDGRDLGNVISGSARDR